MKRIGTNSNFVNSAQRAQTSLSSQTPASNELVSAAANANGIIIQTVVVGEDNQLDPWGVLLVDGVRIAGFGGSSQGAVTIEGPILVPPGKNVSISTYRACHVTITWDDLP